MNHVTKTLLSFLLLSPSPALAQPAPSGSTPPPFVLFDTSSPETEQKALAAHQAGKAAHKDGKLEKARELLEQAYALSPNWKRAADLALVEIALERFREAAEHLDFFLNHADRDAVPDEIFTKFSEYFDLAKSHIATITVTVDEPGAEVWLDGKSIGFSPFIPVVYAKPGKHTISAKKTGFPTEKSEIDAIAGSSPSVKLKLKQEKAPPPTASPQISPPTDRHTFLGMPPWVSISIGLGFAAAGAGLGYIFALQGREYANESARLYNTLQKYDRSQVPQGTPVCTHPSFVNVEECKTLPQQLENWKFKEKLSIGAYIGAGTFALGSVGLAVWKYAIPSKSGAVRTSIGPVVSPEIQGFELQGRF